MSSDYQLDIKGNTDLRQRIYQQDVDIGFDWQHFSQGMENQKSLDQNFNKDNIILGDYVIDGETGEQESKPNSTDNFFGIQGNLPGVLSKPDDFDIEEYLELLENADFPNLEEPIDAMLKKDDELMATNNNNNGNLMQTNNQAANHQDFTNQESASNWNEMNTFGEYQQQQQFNYVPTFTSNQAQQQINNSFAASSNNVVSTSLTQPSSMFETTNKVNSNNNNGYHQQTQQVMPQVQSNEIFDPISLNHQGYLESLQLHNSSYMQMNNTNDNTSNAMNAFAPNQITNPMMALNRSIVQSNNFAMSQLNLEQNMHPATQYPMDTSEHLQEPGQVFFDLDKDVNISNNTSEMSGPPDMFMDTFPMPPTTSMDNSSPALAATNQRPPLPPTAPGISYLEEYTGYDPDLPIKSEPGLISNQPREHGAAASSVVVVKQEVFDEKTLKDMRNVEHNHTYDGTNGVRKPPVKKPEPSGSRKSRDEKKAQELDIPFTLDEIVFTPVDEFNEMLSRVQLTSEQQLLIKDIRRRGKNKIAAQNCRKRKVETINSMEEDVDLLRKKKEELLREQELLTKQKLQIEKEYDLLRNEVLSTFSNSRSTSSGANNATTSASSSSHHAGSFVVNGNDMYPMTSLSRAPQSARQQLTKIHFSHIKREGNQTSY